MYYNLTLQRATGITHAVHGDFSGNKQCEIIVSHGKVLEFFICDLDVKKFHTQLSVEMFGIIRSLLSFRLPEQSKDFLAVGSDSGRMVVLMYDSVENTFVKVLEDVCGTPGCRSNVPGQFLAADPHGQVIVIGAIESHLHAYSWIPKEAMFQSPATKLQNPFTILYDMIGVDRGFESKPTFACLEINCKDADDDPTLKAVQSICQTLTFYELSNDMWNRKTSCSLKERANLLIAVPGGKLGYGGILVCCENCILYKNYADDKEAKCSIPRRDNDLDDPERGVIFVCSVTCQTESSFYILAQTEQGDIFKIRLEIDKNLVVRIKMKYFDTVPVASAMCILDNNFLFVASEFGNHTLYEMKTTIEDDCEPEFSSALAPEEGETFFTPREWKYLKQADTIKSLSPIMDCHMNHSDPENSPHLWLACGQGPNSTLRLLSLKNPSVICNFSESPMAVWSAKRSLTDCWDEYIIVAFPNSTSVLAIGDTFVKMIDLGFIQDTTTLAFIQLQEGTYVQIHPQGFRLIFATASYDWNCPDSKMVVNCAANQHQILIALDGGLLIYFVTDVHGQFNEPIGYSELSAEVLCMTLSNTDGKAKFAVVGLHGNIVQIISLDEEDGLKVVFGLSLPDVPASLAVSEMTGSNRNKSIYIYVGLQNGMLYRFVVNPLSLTLTDNCTKSLGNQPVKMFKVKDAVIVISNNVYLNYHSEVFHLIPISNHSMDHVSAFSTKFYLEGIIAISGTLLRFLTLEDLNSVFRQVTVPLEHTPRKFVIDSNMSHLIVIETDHNAVTDIEKQHQKSLIAQEMIDSANQSEKESLVKSAELFLKNSLPEATFGSPKGGFGSWASIIRVVDLSSQLPVSKVSLDQNQAALSMSLVKFSSQIDDEFLLVGVTKDLILNPLLCTEGLIRTYRISETKSLELMHLTEVEGIPAAICPFQGKVLIGVGKYLRLYDLGKKKLLRQCENKTISDQIVNISVVGNRVVVGTKKSFIFLTYKQDINQLVVTSSNLDLSYINTAALLDDHTLGGADKHGNIFVIRIPSISSGDDSHEIDKYLQNSIWSQGALNCELTEAEVVASFYVGEIVTSIQRTTLVSGGFELLLYTTLSGTIGVLVPLISDDMQDFFRSLEMHLQSGRSSLCGRDHLAFRSYHLPVKNVIDGDLCEQFSILPCPSQDVIAKALGGVKTEVLKIIQEVRSKVVGDSMPFGPLNSKESTPQQQQQADQRFAESPTQYAHTFDNNLLYSH